MRIHGSMRVLGRHWKLTAISAVSISVAMALGILALSVLNTILILPPAAPAPDRLVTMYTRTDGSAIDQVSYPDWQYYRQHNDVFADIAAAPNTINVSEDTNFGGRVAKVIGRPVSENYFSVLGVRPFLGRLFTSADEHGHDSIAVITWDCWTRLGSDPKILGKVLAKNTIIGVTPKDFAGSFYGLNGDMFTPLHDFNGTPWHEQREVRQLFLIGRLKPGVTWRQANAEMAGLSAQLASAYPQADKGRSVVLARTTLLPPDLIPTAELMGGILMALVILVLLIACANVANLLLAVAVGRRQEAVIKLALGASRGRLIRDFLKESTFLCAAGGLVGYAIAAAVIARFSAITVTFPQVGSFTFGLNLRLDFTVAAFAILLVLLASVATGLAPALYASSAALAQILSGELVVGGTGKGVRRNVLVVVQLAVCTLVLVGMGLCQSSLYKLRHVDTGFSARNLVAATIYMQGEGYNEERGKQFYSTLRQSVAGLPGVESVALSVDLPLFGASPEPVRLPETVEAKPIAHTTVDPDYFATFGIPILAGRAFNAGDREGGPEVAIINHKMAEMFWPGQDAVGRTILAGSPGRRVTVVGVARDGKYLDLDEATQPFLYDSLAQHYQGAINVVARTKGDPVAWVQPVANALRGLGLKILIQPVTFEGWLLTLLTQRIAAATVAGLSGLGLLLAVIGLFGAISYAVSERKKELGIRVALGARPGQLMSMVLRQTLLVTGIGVGVGILLGVAATVVFQSQLYGIGALEWVVLIPTALGMLGLSMLVAYLSARPWIAVNPMEAVRAL